MRSMLLTPSSVACRPAARDVFRPWAAGVAALVLTALGSVSARAWTPASLPADARAPHPCMAGEHRLPVGQAVLAPSKFAETLGRCPVGTTAPVRDPGQVPALRRIDEPARAAPAPEPLEPPARVPVMPRVEPVTPRQPGAADRAPADRPATERVSPLPKVRLGDPRVADRIRQADEVLAPAAARNDIDPLLLHAVAWVESRHRPDAVSPAGARGLMQVMPQTGARFGVQSERHLHEPAFNAAAAAAYLKWLQGEFGNDLTLVLAAYNAGEGAVRRHGGRVPPYPETTAYVRDVIAVYRELSAARDGANAGSTP
jgi:soluble lytic murein transglycosylase-like protein